MSFIFMSKWVYFFVFNTTRFAIYIKKIIFVIFCINLYCVSALALSKVFISNTKLVTYKCHRHDHVIINHFYLNALVRT